MLRKRRSKAAANVIDFQELSSLPDKLLRNLAIAVSKDIENGAVEKTALLERIMTAVMGKRVGEPDDGMPAGEVGRNHQFRERGSTRNRGAVVLPGKAEGSVERKTERNESESTGGSTARDGGDRESGRKSAERRRLIEAVFVVILVGALWNTWNVTQENEALKKQLTAARLSTPTVAEPSKPVYITPRASSGPSPSPKPAEHLGRTSPGRVPPS